MRIRDGFAVALTAGVVVGCGPADVPLSRARAGTIARAISLTAADVRGRRPISHRTPSGARLVV